MKLINCEIFSEKLTLLRIFIRRSLHTDTVRHLNVARESRMILLIYFNPLIESH